MLKKLRNRRQGQTSLEYALIIIIALAAFLSIQAYFKRGIQGQWKKAVDDLGDQYDPRYAVTDIQHTVSSNTDTRVIAFDQPGGQWTARTDVTNSLERKTGTSQTGAY